MIDSQDEQEVGGAKMGETPLVHNIGIISHKYACLCERCHSCILREFVFQALT